MKKIKINFKKRIRSFFSSFDPRNFIRFFKEKRWRKWTWKSIIRTCSYWLLGFLLFIGILFAWFAKDLPTSDKIANIQIAQSTKIYDRTGQTLLYETGDEKRTIITDDQISQYVKDATVSVEDPNFYSNFGIEPKAILSAIGSRLLGKTNTLRGGSTITQQYVKNSFLTSDRSLSRKIKEAILSIEIEFMYNKEEILTMYLNEIPYGNATGGIEAAAQLYYGVSAKNVTLAQAATLAAIPQAPTYYSLYGSHTDALVARRNYVLEQMVKYGKITQEQADAAKNEDTTTVGTIVKEKHDSILAPHFALYVLQQAADKYGEDAVSKGLTITSTLDWNKQQAAVKAVDNGATKLTKYNASNAALIAVDPKTGQILSMVGSKNYFDTTIDGNVNITDSERQPGSSFKPIVYATALKQVDFSPSKILFDLETNFGGTPSYTPQNYNGKFNGPVTARQALSNSLNIPAVKTLALAGIDNVISTASDLGITSLTNRSSYGLSLALGVAEISPIQMASAFGVFANSGTRNETTSFLKVTDASGEVLYDYDKDHPTATQVLDPQIAYEIANILSDNNSRALVFGTRTQLYFADRTVAVKTGTTSNFKDAWAIGFTPSIAVAVWTGNSDNTAMKTGADGSVLAAPIFHQYIVNALADTANESFTQPSGIQAVTVEKYSNKLPTQYSSETTTDIFASWQVPTNQDDLHKAVKVCKGTDLLAPDNAPDSMVEEKVYVDLHSEKPSNSNWENPVRAWASEHGMTSTVPTTYCDISSIAPTISLTAPSNNATVSGTTTITVSASGASGIKSVTYYIDGVSIGESTNSPYSLTYNFSAVSEGSHALSAQITDNNSMTATSTVNITIADTSSSDQEQD